MNEQHRMLFGRIEIEMNIAEDGELIHTVTTSGHNGDDLPLIQALGALEMAKDSLLHGPDEEG